MNFRLDPREAARDPPPTPPVTAQAPASRLASSAPPPGAVPTPPATGAARWTALLRERRALVIGAVVVLLLGSGAAVAAMWALDIGPFAYPDKYLLHGDEIPRGLLLPPIPGEVRAETGMTSNPGEMNPDRFTDEFGGGPRPEAVWAEFLGETRDDDPVILIFAIKYANEDDADSAAGRFRFACAGGFGSGRVSVLRDGNVLVVTGTEDSEHNRWVAPVVVALKAQHAPLTTIC